MPMIWPPPSLADVVSPSPIRKTVLLVTVVTSIGPLNGIDRRGWRLKPSSELRMLTSAASDGRLAASGSGRLTRRLVSWLVSATVKRSLGNGPPSGELRSNAADVAALAARSFGEAELERQRTATAGTIQRFMARSLHASAVTFRLSPP